VRWRHHTIKEPASIKVLSTAKMPSHFANVILLSPALLILIKYGEMKARSMTRIGPMNGVTRGFDINQRQGDINRGR
jgi:hypothetical protein